MNARLYDDSFYVNGNIIPAAFFQNVDTAQYQAVNARTGGTWNPSSPIEIGGAGMAAQGPWSLGASPAIEAPAGSALKLTHGDDNWVVLGTGHSGRTRILYTSLGPAADTSHWTPGSPTNGQPSLAYYSASQGAVVQGVASSFLGGGRLTMPLRVHDGASLAGSAVALYFFIGNAHTGGLPVNLPQMRVLRLDMFGNSAPLGTDPTVAGWLGNGWQSVFGGSPPATPADYYNSGTEWAITYTCDAGTIVDTSKYAYVVQIIDESGTNSVAGNTFFAAASGNASISGPPAPMSTAIVPATVGGVVTSERSARGRHGDHARGDAHGLRLHPERASRGTRNCRAVVDETIVRAVRQACARGASLVDVAAAHGLTRHHVWQLVHRRCWAWLDAPEQPVPAGGRVTTAKSVTDTE